MKATISQAWREQWRIHSFRVQLVGTIICLVLVLLSFSHFIDGVEHRSGVSYEDPLLIRFTPHDLTWLTFAFIYSGLIVGVVVLTRHPEQLLLALQGYLVMVVIRTAAMYLLPLDPPPLLIPLKDPFVQYFGSGEVPTKDLFFSGHTATLFLLFLTVHGRCVKTLFLLSTIGVAVCVVLQHVHYTIDVFSAPFFSYAAYRIVVVLRNKI